MAADRGVQALLLDPLEGNGERARLQMVGDLRDRLAAGPDPALTPVEQEGLDATISRHQRSRDATRAGLRAAGLAPWVTDDAGAAAIATLVACPAGLVPGELLAAALSAVPEAPLELAPGALGQQALRVAHTGENARLAPVLAALTALAFGLESQGIETDAGAALTAALSGWQALPA